MSEPKYCEDCKWCRPARLFFIRNYEFAKCASPKGDEASLVSRTRPGKGNYCSVERKLEHYCGREGKFWEPK